MDLMPVIVELEARIRLLERVREAAIVVGDPDGADESDWLELDAALAAAAPAPKEGGVT